MLTSLALVLGLSSIDVVAIKKNSPAETGSYYVFFVNYRDYIWEGMPYEDAMKLLGDPESFFGGSGGFSFTYPKFQIRVSYGENGIRSITPLAATRSTPAPGP